MTYFNMFFYFVFKWLCGLVDKICSIHVMIFTVNFKLELNESDDESIDGLHSAQLLPLFFLKDVTMLTGCNKELGDYNLIIS